MTPVRLARATAAGTQRETSISQELVGSDAGFLSFFHDAAVEEVNGALGEVGIALVVSDHADGGAVAVQVAQQLHDRFAVFGVQVSGGLVSHQDERIADQGAGHGDTLLLTAGELRGIVAEAMSHADALERVLHFLLALAGASAAIGERQLDVFVDGEIADQVEGLKDEANLAIANARAFADGELGDGLAVQLVNAVGLRIEQTENGQQRRFAAAGWAGNRDVP